MWIREKNNKHDLNIMFFGLKSVDTLFVIISTLLMFFLSACTAPRIPLTKTPAPIRATTRPYVIKSKLYMPQKHFDLVQKGVASYYGIRDGFHGRKTATGERFNAFALTAAHKTLPLPCIIHITNLDNGKTLVLKVNDRGPFKCSRILDVSEAAAKQLGFYHKGTANIQIRTLVSESLKLAENQPNYRKNSEKIGIKKAPLSKMKRYCIHLSCGHLTQAQILKNQMSKWGPVFLKKTSTGYCVMLHPHDSLSIASIYQRIPKKYTPRIVYQNALM